MTLRAELSQWAANTEAGSKIEAAFFRAVSMPWGSISVRRPPRETRPELTKLIATSPNDAELYELRALEDEQDLDFAAAEADWKKRADVAKDHAAAQVDLADFYHRRVRAREEFDALTLAAIDPSPDSDKWIPDEQQRAWKINTRLIALIDEARLDPVIALAPCGGWIGRYSKDPGVYRQCFEFALNHQQIPAADQIVNRYKRAFPDDEEFPIEARAEMVAKNAPAQALTIYEQNFKPLWPQKLVADYFALLKQTNSLRVYLDRTRASIAANPMDLTSAVRLFDYWQQQNNLALASRALAEFRTRKESRKSPWTADELLTLARLYESAHDYGEAARNYYALYSVAQSDDAVAENALASLARMILTAPEQPIAFGTGNLTLYRDVATMDPHPGFLNGVLSLLLNNSDTPERAAIEEQNAGPYFRRARAAELVLLFESRFPNSAQRADLRERVIDAYAIYGSNDGVIRAGTKFLTDFPNAANRTSVALRVADAYARTNQSRQEFAIYDSLLAELARRADAMPIGSIEQTAQTTPAARSADAAPGAAAAAENAEAKFNGVRSPEYARVLDRYVARLVSLKRVRDALAIYRREIDRNPNDPGLYDILAAFLDQNRLGAEMEQTYQRAIAQFPDHTWEHKLARWYLRQRRQADVARLTQDVIKTFSGNELAGYFQEVVHPGAPVGPALYLQLNVYAHQRFPHHVGFVRNLLSAYTTTATLNDAAYLALLREHWLDADDLRHRYFERLSRGRTLGTELAAVRTPNANAVAGKWEQLEDQNPAAARLLAEGEAWRCHFEAAAPIFLAIESRFPADAAIGKRTVAIYRSLGTIQPKFTDTAIAAGEKLSDANRRDTQALTQLGEMEADRERFDKAAAYWDRIPAIAPGKPDGYLESATIFWDYYRYSDALRTIENARKQFNTQTIYTYEAGAIFENQRDYRDAVREYTRGAIDQLNASVNTSNAERRLIALARRPELHDDVEQLSSGFVSARDPQMGAYRLRVALLRNQGRRDDLATTLTTVAGRTNSMDLLTTIENDARVDGFAKAQETAIQREIAITTDPVEKMRLGLSLARYYEGQQQIPQGAQTVEALYRANPAILGVVRATVDYEWRTKNTKRAIDVLEESAGRAEAGYRSQFILEAARKSNEAGDYTRARAFAARLLSDQPYRAEYIGVMADAYGRAGDDRGLRSFYDAKIRELSAASLPQTQKTEQIAAMRRAMIPVLTKTKDFSAALDQYIEVLNRYPEDESFAREAAAYASANGIAQRLRDYYTKAVADSPKDYRWAMVLGRVDTQLEDFPAAIAAYAHAAEVRPDRADLLTSRLALEERLLHFDEAGATAEKLYELTYRNPDWMVKLAQIRARQARIADAVAALQKAWIDGRTANVRAYFDVAQKLEEWGALSEARRFAEQGMKRITPDNHDEMLAGIEMYARLLARLRAYDTADVDVIKVGGKQIAAVVATYYSPEEKTKYARWVQAHAGTALTTGIVQNAGIADVEANLWFQRVMVAPASAGAQANKQSLVQLQKQRLAFDELGVQMEGIDRVTPPNARGQELMEAASAYRAAGNAAGELRVLQTQNGRGALQGIELDRYARLLFAQPASAIAAISGERRDAPANGLVDFAVEHASATVTQQAIAARGAKQGPLWTNAYTALLGLYFDTNAPAVRSAFTSVLGDMTIGARVGKPVDRDAQLAGEPWFYYGGRYGEYLGVTKQAGAADFLPAMIEGAPQQSQPYFEMAEYYRGAGDPNAAAADYRNALELNADRADAHDRLAEIAMAQGRRDEAIAEWKLAIAALEATMNRGAAPPKFWIDANTILHHVGETKTLAAIKPDLDRMLRAYFKRNGSYQADALLEGVMAASGDAPAGLAWIDELSRVAADPVQFLAAILDRPWMPEAQRATLYSMLVDRARAKVAVSFGDERNYAQSELSMRQVEWAKYLLNHGEAARAEQIVAGLPEDRRDSPDVVTIRIRAAARSGKLAALLAAFDEKTQPSTLRAAAMELDRAGDATSSRRVLELVYTRELNAGQFDVSNFLGLAEIRISEGNVAGAVTLLKRAELLSGDAFSTLDASAGLFENTGHAAEAGQFLADLVKAEPWNLRAKERLAAIQNAADSLTAVAKSGDAMYATRIAAALAIRKMKGAAVAGTDAELVFLSSQSAFDAGAVNKPYWVAARREFASLSRDNDARVNAMRAAIAIDPRTPKIDLFRAALAARKDALAIAVAGEILPPLRTSDDEYASWMAEQFASNLPMADRIAMARGLGEAYQRTGDFKSAIAYDRVAQHLQPSDPVRRAMETMRAQLDADAKNSARRPVIANQIEQDRLVHPKVVAR